MNFFKPFFKRIFQSNSFTVNCYKLLRFKRKKWLKILTQLKFSSIKHKFKLIDQKKFSLSFYSIKLSSYTNRFKLYFLFSKNIKCIYYTLKLKLIKLNRVNLFLSHLEKRLDVLLIRSKFCITLRTAKKLILSSYVFVNKFKINVKSFIVNSGSFIKIQLNRYKFKSYLIHSSKWQMPIDNLIINYSTKEFLAYELYEILIDKILYFPHNFNLKIISISFYSLMVKQLAVN